jgi:hypothetical protein
MSVQRRSAVIMAAAATALLASLAACNVDRVGPEHSEAADRAVVAVQVAAELYVPDDAGMMLLRNVPLTMETLEFPRSLRAALRADGGDFRSTVVVRHFKDARGRTHTIGFIPDPSGRPPEFVYAFENGRIVRIVGSSYQRSAGGWRRIRTRITSFDTTGRVALQTVLAPARTAMVGTQVTRFAADAARVLIQLVTPRPLYAEETAPCTAEWLTYAAVSFALASASTGLVVAIAACTESAGTLPVCGTIETLTAAFLAALAAWNVALDKLIACQLRNASATTSGGSTTGGSSITRPDDEEEIIGGTKTVTQFIEDAMTSGNYSCSGDRCVYYAS